MYKFFGCMNEYEPIEFNKYTEMINDDDCEFDCLHIEKLLVNRELNQSLMFHRYSCGDHDENFVESDVVDIIDSIWGERYKNIVDVLNTKKDITICFSQIPFTTGDYIVIHDKYIDKCDDIHSYIKSCEFDNSHRRKYEEIKNKKGIPLFGK